MCPFDRENKFFHGIVLTAALICVFSSIHAQNSLNRDMDPVIVKGDSLPYFNTDPISNIKVLVYDAASGEWHAIPMQVDEVLPGGNYFGDTNGTLDPLDELLFMAKDMGDQAPGRHVWPDDEESKQRPRYEIMAVDPGSQQRVYAYIYSSATLPTSPNSHIRYVNDRILAETYSLAHNSDGRIVSGFPDSMAIPTAVGGDGIDFLDRHRVRLKIDGDKNGLGMHINNIKESMNNATVTVEIDNLPDVTAQATVKQKRAPDVLAGPIRIKRRNTLDIKLTGSILGFSVNYIDSLKVDYTYYPNYFELWSGARNLPRPERKDGFYMYVSQMRYTQALNGNGFGMIYFNQLSTTAIRINHVFHNDSKVLDPIAWPGASWYAEVAEPDPNWSDPQGNKAPLRKGTAMTFLELRQEPIAQSFALYVNEYDDVDGYRVYGDAGLNLATNSGSLPITGVLDFLLKTFIIPDDYSYDQASSFYSKYSVPIQLDFAPQVNDSIAPARIEDLAIAAVQDTAVTLTWTAPGDDGNSGRKAAYYIIRYSTEPMGEDIWAWWASATTIPNLPGPGEPGSIEQLTVGDLLRDTQYYFSIRAGDEVPNWASLSPPAAIITPVELASFVAKGTENKVSLEWTTASETNNLGFAVERKLGSEQDWLELAFIRGNGTSATSNHYAYQDSPNSFGEISYRLRQVDMDGAVSYSQVIQVIIQAPDRYVLAQNYPNPFNPSTTIAFEIPSAAHGKISLTIYDMLGRQVRTLVGESAKAGSYRVEWDGLDDNGVQVSSGVYFYILQASGFRATRKMVKLQ
jgi:hypothetical protein